MKNKSNIEVKEFFSLEEYFRYLQLQRDKREEFSAKEISKIKYTQLERR